MINRFKNAIKKGESQEAIASDKIARESVKLLSNTTPSEHQPITTFSQNSVIEFAKLKEGTILRLLVLDPKGKFKWTAWIIIGSNKEGQSWLYRLAGPDEEYLRPPSHPAFICNSYYLVPITTHNHIVINLETNVKDLIRQMILALRGTDEFKEYESENLIESVEKVDVMWGGLGQRSPEKKSVPTDAQRVGFSSPLPQPT